MPLFEIGESANSSRRAHGATPLDFAYEIHTDVGHRCVGAIMARLKEGYSAVEPPGPAVELLERRESPRRTTKSTRASQ